MRILVAGLCILGTAASAAAADRKVPSTDYPTIQAAADAAQPGDRILVGKGVFQENVVLNQSGVQIIGKKSILDGSLGAVDGVALTVGGDDNAVSGLTFRNGIRHIVAGGARFHLAKCVFRRTSDYNPSVAITGDDALVTGCTTLGALDAAFQISGNGAHFLKNRISRSGETGVSVSGTGALVDGNSIFVIEDGHPIRVVGAGATVTRNKVGYTDGSGILVDSDGCLVQSNSCTSCGETGIEVTGNAIQVLRNTVTFTVDDADGITIESRSSMGGGLVEGNKVSDSVQYGFYLSGAHNLLIRLNTAQRCGSEQEQAFYLDGNGNTLLDNQVTDSNDDGFRIAGNANVLARNVARNCLTDGFDIRGAGTSLEDCSATGCDGEGFDNHGTATEVIGCTFKGNRIDFAAALTGGATFGTVSGNTVGTGGVATQSEVE